MLSGDFPVIKGGIRIGLLADDALEIQRRSSPIEEGRDRHSNFAGGWRAGRDPCGEIKTLFAALCGGGGHNNTHTMPFPGADKVDGGRRMETS